MVALKSNGHIVLFSHALTPFVELEKGATHIEVYNHSSHCFTFAVMVIFEHGLCLQLLFKRDYAIKLYSRTLCLRPQQCGLSMSSRELNIKLTFSTQNETCEPMK